jgi:hypothetical protein
VQISITLEGEAMEAVMGDTETNKLKMRIRFDYCGVGRPGRVFSKGRESEEVAEEIREQRAILLRNLPIQGAHVEEINTNGEIYLLRDDSGDELAYAPIEVVLTADTIEDVLPFLLRDEFRKVEVLEPQEVTLDKNAVERIIYKMNEELRNYRLFLEKRINSK